ncbi:unnamed protein product [Bursaphelenchus xylophilus]|uniref:(pine wood nematode) hypothetical protein n=1 Tax=Bursaphelenchus xylophilus TaxID=6326 RepID=A0A1I7SF57_BURXY|nr:unnamed protein product [Bursaphelenchus xylophilus]CAG9078747.1 unnamed protein product [Bursaphelenchus xylophilus]
MKRYLPAPLNNVICQAQDQPNAPRERIQSSPHIRDDEMEMVDRMARSFDETGLDEINEIIDHNYYKDEDTPKIVKEHLKFSNDDTDIVFTFEDTSSKTLSEQDRQKVATYPLPPFCSTANDVPWKRTHPGRAGLIFHPVPVRVTSNSLGEGRNNILDIGRKFGPLGEQNSYNGMVNGIIRRVQNLIHTPNQMGSPGYEETARRFFAESRYPSTESSSSGSSSKENIPKFQNSIPRVQKLNLTSDFGPKNREVRDVGPVRSLAVFSQSLPSNPKVNIDAVGPCAYCLSTGQRKTIAYSHSKFLCPILSSLRPCKICGARGLDNHTAMHCPRRQKVQLTLNRVQTKIFSERDLPFMKVLPKGSYNMPKWTSECC